MSKTSSDKYAEKYGIKQIPLNDSEVIKRTEENKKQIRIGELQSKLSRQREERYEQHHAKFDEYARERRMRQQGGSDSNYINSPSVTTLGIPNVLNDQSKEGQKSEMSDSLDKDFAEKKKIMIKSSKERSIGEGRMNLRRASRL